MLATKCRCSCVKVEYLFTDKTGTLTRNEMVFRKCSCNGLIYEEINGVLRDPKTLTVVRVTVHFFSIEFSSNCSTLCDSWWSRGHITWSTVTWSTVTLGAKIGLQCWATLSRVGCLTWYWGTKSCPRKIEIRRINWKNEIVRNEVITNN